MFFEVQLCFTIITYLASSNLIHFNFYNMPIFHILKYFNLKKQLINKLTINRKSAIKLSTKTAHKRTLTNN
jgi:hypothetical protein